MTCRTVLDELTDYVDGELPLGRRVVVQTHLRLCRHCRHYLHNFRVTLKACRHAVCDASEPQPVSREFAESILRKL